MWWRVLENISHICRIIGTFKNFTGITFSHNTRMQNVINIRIYDFSSPIYLTLVILQIQQNQCPLPIWVLTCLLDGDSMWSEAGFSCHPHCLEQGFPQLGLKLGFSVVWKGWAGVCANYLTNMSFVSTNEFVCNLIPPWFIGRGRTFQLQFIGMIRDLWSWI